MRFTFVRALACAAAVVVSHDALAHGPQIQVTLDGVTITTRELTLDGPYSGITSTAPKSVYVMAVKENAGVWYSRPNLATDPILPGVPKYYSGPGFAWGWQNPAADPLGPTFLAGTKLRLEMTQGLKKWDGVAFVDAGAAEVEAFSGAQVIKTNDVAPAGAIEFPATGVVIDPEAHTTVRYRFLGDGLSTAVAPIDGVYLLGLQLTNTNLPNEVVQRRSEPFYFVLSKNGGAATTAAAASLGFDPARIQNLVPEPTTGALIGVAGAGLALSRRCSASARVLAIARS